MREIKFKFVCDPGTKWAKVYPLTRDGVRECRIDNKDENYTDEDYVWEILNGGFSNIILLQFTGLKDRDGVDIYEGDIVRATTKYGIPVFEVTWEAIEGEQGTYGYGYGIGHELATYEVIGNVHQNPELLNARDDG